MSENKTKFDSLSEFQTSFWGRAGATPDGQRKVRREFTSWSKRAQLPELIAKSRQLWTFFRSPKASLLEKSICAGALLYCIAPIDLVPDVIPLAGFLDDLGVVSLVLAYILNRMEQFQKDDTENKMEQPENKAP